MNKFRWSNL